MPNCTTHWEPSGSTPGWASFAGRPVRQLREKRGATQEAIARDAGITTATLSLIERGQANPTWDILKKITAALGSSMGELGKLADELG